MTEIQQRAFDAARKEVELKYPDPALQSYLANTIDLARRDFESLCQGVDENDPRFIKEATNQAYICIGQCVVMWHQALTGNTGGSRGNEG